MSQFTIGASHDPHPAHIAAILALAKAPPGMVCVPVEPTDKQECIGADIMTEGNGYTTAEKIDVRLIYRAMIASHKEG